MEKLFAEFQATEKKEWVELIHKELKGESPDLLQKFNPIEEILLPSYFHKTDLKLPFSDPGKAPFTRGIRNDTNDWHICTLISITSEKEANKLGLDALMSGATSLQFVAANETEINFTQLFENIGLEYIQTSFIGKNSSQIFAFNEAVKGFDSYSNLNSTTNFVSNTKNYHVSGYDVQQAGATSWQELAIAAAEGHQFLVEQLDAGSSIDEAAGNIHFVLGIGTKYFYETAKIRAFRTIWAKIIERYSPEYACSKAATISAKSGFTHISLKDPHTNLLRQTTQALSVIVGGVQELIIQPYDCYSTEKNTNFTQRMATNISLVLKEESYLNSVIDPAGGSYSLDILTETIAERSWALFQEIEDEGGITIPQVRAKLSFEISEKAQQRKEQIQIKSEKLIGINIFPNPTEINANWEQLPLAWNNLPSLQLEQL